MNTEINLKGAHISFNVSTFVKSGLLADEFIILMLIEQKPFKMAELASLLNLSERTIYRCMQTLKEKGFVLKIGRKGVMSYEPTNKLAEII